MKILIFTATLLSLTFSSLWAPVAAAETVHLQGSAIGTPEDDAANNVPQPTRAEEAQQATLKELAAQPEFGTLFEIKNAYCSAGKPVDKYMKMVIGIQRAGASMHEARVWGHRVLVVGNVLLSVQPMIGTKDSPCDNNGAEVELITVFEKVTTKNSASKK